MAQTLQNLCTHYHFKLPLSYKSEVKRNVYKAVYNDIDVIVKFTTTYGEEVHKFCFEKGFAPQLFICQEVSIQHSMIIMEEIYGVTVTQYLQGKDNTVKHAIKVQCDTMLQTMHKAGFCHGDFRPCNLMIDKHNKLFLIDFDWSGKAGSTKYPYFMNHRGIDWANGATDGEYLQPQHDTHLCDIYFSDCK